MKRGMTRRSCRRCGTAVMGLVGTVALLLGLNGRVARAAQLEYQPPETITNKYRNPEWVWETWAGTSATDSVLQRIERLRWTFGRKGEMIDSDAAEVRGYAEDRTQSPACRARALDLLMILMRQGAGDADTMPEHKEQDLGQAEQYYQEYRQEYAGHDAVADWEMATRLCTVKIDRLRLMHQDSRLDEALRAADEVAALAPAAEKEAQRSMWHANAYFAVGQFEPAGREYAAYFKSAAQPYAWYYSRLADCLLRTGRASEVVDVAAEGLAYHLKTRKYSPWLEDALSAQLGTALSQADLSDEALGQVLARVVEKRRAVEAILSGVAARQRADGHMDEALGFIKLAYAFATMDRASAVLRQYTDWLKQSGRLAPQALKSFLDGIKYGPAGPDGVAGTVDDLPDVTGDIPMPLGVAAQGALTARLAALSHDPPNLHGTLIARGNLLLLLGRPQEALRAYRTAYAVASVDDVEETSNRLAAALKAADGNLLRATQWPEYHKYGPAGADGKLGTTDDVPLKIAWDELPPLPAEVMAALTRGTQEGSVADRVFALFGRGANVEAMRVVLQAGNALDAKTIAAAIKSYDGYWRRGEQYLRYRGVNAGPPPDLSLAAPSSDPLDDIRRELAREP